MKHACAFLLALWLGISAAGQGPSEGAKPSSRAVIEGIVTKDSGGEPVKKAVIELIAENQSAGGDYTAVTGADGSFRIEGILPGRYHLFAERTGFLEVESQRERSEGRVLTLTAGQELKGLLIRLQAAAIVRGRVTDEDGEPMPSAEVSVLRQTFASGHNRWEPAGSERTNDLGEYRIPNLPAGNFYVAVKPPPDFKSLIEAAGAPDSHDTAGDKPASSYQTTYYPGTLDRSQAAPIQLHAGDDFPVNFSLTPSPSMSIRGSVLNLPPRSSATIMLQSRDFNMTLNGAEIHRDGSFVIRDVAPGAYTILATVESGQMPLMARQSLQLSGNSVDGLRLAPQPGAWIHGRLRAEAKSNVARFDASQMYLTLRPADGDDDLAVMVTGDGFSRLARVSADGSFEWKNVPPGNYYVQLVSDAGVGADWYLKSVLAGSRETEESGLNVEGGAIGLDLVASANGAAVDGLVADAKGSAIADAVIVAVPAVRLRARTDRYLKTVTDQSGRFTLHGIPPGEYTLFAWENVEGEAYYDPEFLKKYDGQGMALRLSEGERKSVQVPAIGEAEEP